MMYDDRGRQTGPALGQTYWIDRLMSVASYVYKADDFDLNVSQFRDIYPEERFAEAELRAKKLITSVNKMRRELNGGKEFGSYEFYIVYCNVFGKVYGLDIRTASDPLYDRGNAFPFGLFKTTLDCKTCISEFGDELEWFFKEYLPLMEELNDYDWSQAPGRGG